MLIQRNWHVFSLKKWLKGNSELMTLLLYAEVKEQFRFNFIDISVIFSGLITFCGLSTPQYINTSRVIFGIYLLILMSFWNYFGQSLLMRFLISSASWSINNLMGTTYSSNDSLFFVLLAMVRITRAHARRWFWNKVESLFQSVKNF